VIKDEHFYLFEHFVYNKSNLFYVKLKLYSEYKRIVRYENLPNSLLFLESFFGKFPKILYVYGILSTDYKFNPLKWKTAFDIDIINATKLYVLLKYKKYNYSNIDKNMQKYRNIFLKLNNDCQQILSLRTYDSSYTYIPKFLIKKYQKDSYMKKYLNIDNYNDDDVDGEKRYTKGYRYYHHHDHEDSDEEKYYYYTSSSDEDDDEEEEEKKKFSNKGSYINN